MNAPLEPMVPIETVARHFTVSVSTIRAWLRAGHIPADTYVKIGNTYRFQISGIVAALSGRPKDDVKYVEPVEPDAPVQLELNFNDPDENV